MTHPGASSHCFLSAQADQCEDGKQELPEKGAEGRQEGG